LIERYRYFHSEFNKLFVFVIIIYYIQTMNNVPQFFQFFDVSVFVSLVFKKLLPSYFI